MRRWWIRNLWEKTVHAQLLSAMLKLPDSNPTWFLDWNRVEQTATMTCTTMFPFHMGTTELVAVSWKLLTIFLNC